MHVSYEPLADLNRWGYFKARSDKCITICNMCRNFKITRRYAGHSKFQIRWEIATARFTYNDGKSPIKPDSLREYRCDSRISTYSLLVYASDFLYLRNASLPHKFIWSCCTTRFTPKEIHLCSEWTINTQMNDNYRKTETGCTEWLIIDWRQLVI